MQIDNKKYSNMKTNVTVMEHNIRNDAIRMKISKSIEDITQFFSYFSKTLVFQTFDHENLG